MNLHSGFDTCLKDATPLGGASLESASSVCIPFPCPSQNKRPTDKRTYLTRSQQYKPATFTNDTFLLTFTFLQRFKDGVMVGAGGVFRAAVDTVS